MGDARVTVMRLDDESPGAGTLTAGGSDDEDGPGNPPGCDGPGKGGPDNGGILGCCSGGATVAVGIVNLFV